MKRFLFISCLCYLQSCHPTAVSTTEEKVEVVDNATDNRKEKSPNPKPKLNDQNEPNSDDPLRKGKDALKENPPKN